MERFYGEEFKQKLAIGFLNFSILTNEMIQLRLNNGKVKEWKVELTVLEAKAMVDLSFSNKSMRVKTFSSKSSQFPHLVEILTAFSSIHSASY